MKMMNLFLRGTILCIMMVSNVSFATFVAPSDAELRANCYPGSPSLQSDICWGKTYEQMNMTYPFGGVYYNPVIYGGMNPYVNPYFYNPGINNTDRFYQPKIQYYSYPWYANPQFASPPGGCFPGV